jgi:hypothetical protein
LIWAATKKKTGLLRHVARKIPSIARETDKETTGNTTFSRKRRKKVEREKNKGCNRSKKEQLPLAQHTPTDLYIGVNLLRAQVGHFRARNQQDYGYQEIG